MTQAQPAAGPDYPLATLSHANLALHAGAFLPALISVLTVPDVCAALDDPSSRTTGVRYRAWLKAYSRELGKYADSLYLYRCAVLHQGIGGFSQAAPGTTRVMFVMPGAPILLHRNTASFTNGDKYVIFDLASLITDMTDAINTWWAARRQLQHVQVNVARNISVHPNGYPPAVVGVPVIT